MPEETIQRIVNERADSITIGAPSQGQIKVYFNADDIEDGKKRAKNAIDVMKYAKGLLQETS